jgi:hypothetical protein
VPTDAGRSFSVHTTTFGESARSRRIPSQPPFEVWQWAVGAPNGVAAELWAAGVVISCSRVLDRRSQQTAGLQTQLQRQSAKDAVAVELLMSPANTRLPHLQTFSMYLSESSSKWLRRKRLLLLCRQHEAHLWETQRPEARGVDNSMGPNGQGTRQILRSRNNDASCAGGPFRFVDAAEERDGSVQTLRSQGRMQVKSNPAVAAAASPVGAALVRPLSDHSDTWRFALQLPSTRGQHEGATSCSVGGRSMVVPPVSSVVEICRGGAPACAPTVRSNLCLQSIDEEIRRVDNRPR